MGLRSGLLQYVGDDRYGFPHLTFQEYLAARYIAAQPDPEYIDLVMTHLHEAWWQEVHLLTIGLLGSGSAQKAQEAEANTKKASALLLTILHCYKPPSWLLRSSAHWWVRMIGPGKFLPRLQLERRIAWMLAREFELAARGYAECAPHVTMPVVDGVLSTQAVLLLRDLLHDEGRYKTQENLLTAIGLLQRRRNKAVANALLKDALHGRYEGRAADSLAKLGAGDNEEVVRALLTALHDPNPFVQRGAARSLGELGAGSNEEVVRALLTALHDPFVRKETARSLGRLEIKSGTQRDQALVAFNRLLHDRDSNVRDEVLTTIRKLLDGHPLPGYRWVSLQQRRKQHLRLKRIVIWLVVVTLVLGSTSLLGYLSPNGFVLRYLGVLAALTAIAATIAQRQGWALRNPWESR